MLGIDCLQISFLILISEFKQVNNFYFPKNNQKTHGFLIISGGIEVINSIRFA